MRTTRTSASHHDISVFGFPHPFPINADEKPLFPSIPVGVLSAFFSRRSFVNVVLIRWQRATFARVALGFVRNPMG